MGRGSRGLLEGAGWCRLIGGLYRSRPAVALRRVLTSWWAAAKNTKPAQRPATTLSNGQRRSRNFSHHRRQPSRCGFRWGSSSVNHAAPGKHNIIILAYITQGRIAVPLHRRRLYHSSIIQLLGLSNCSVPSYRTEDAHTARRTEYRWP